MMNKAPSIDEKIFMCCHLNKKVICFASRKMGQPVYLKMFLHTNQDIEKIRTNETHGI